MNGSDGAGTPRGSTPTVVTSEAARSNTADAIVAPTTATNTAGTIVVRRGSTSSTANTHSPVTSVARLVRSTFRRNWRTSSTKPSASVENPNSLGSCPTMIVTARPLR